MIILQMRLLQPFYECMYRYEILRARNEIRDHFSKNLIKDIYEHNGQLISLVRMKLAVVMQDPACNAGVEIPASADMLATVSGSLKQISRLLFPENEILSGWGFIDALRKELNTENTKASEVVTVKGHPCVLEPGNVLILFHAIIELTAMIRAESEGNNIAMEVIYTRKKMKLFIRFSGGLLNINQPLNETPEFYKQRLTLEERMQLIDAKVAMKKMKDGREEIQLALNI